MSLDGILKGQECYNSIDYISNFKKLKFKSFPEFDAIFYPFANLDEIDEIRLHCFPHGMEESKHIWDFRYNSAGWYIEKINRKFNYFTRLYAEKPDASIKKKMDFFWIIKEEYKGLCVIPFEYSARLITSKLCTSDDLKSFFKSAADRNKLDKKIYHTFEEVWKREKEIEKFSHELFESLYELDARFYKFGKLFVIDWLEKVMKAMADLKDMGKNLKHEYWETLLLPITYSLNPPVGPLISLHKYSILVGVENLTNPLWRLADALFRLKDFTTEDIKNRSLNYFKKQISSDFANFSYYESLKEEQQNSLDNFKKEFFKYPISLLSMRGELSLTKYVYLSFPVSMVKYIKGLKQLSPSLQINGNKNDYFIKVCNDDIGRSFLYEFYLTSLGDNIIRNKHECPLKGSNYELSCNNCNLKFARKYCKNSGMIKT